MKVIAADDERISLTYLSELIRGDSSEAEVVSCRNAAEVRRELEGAEVLFIDTDLRDCPWMDLCREAQAVNPNINLIITSSYPDEAYDAISLRPSGFLLKPLSEEAVRTELEELRYLYPTEQEPESDSRLRIQAFGNFEVYGPDGYPLSFQYAKSRELLAYLVDRRGTFCSNAEISTALWGEDSVDSKRSYLKNIRSDLVNTLEQAGYPDVLIRRRGVIAVVSENIHCDYYDWLARKRSAANSYRGEYMSQYAWAEATNTQLKEQIQ